MGDLTVSEENAEQIWAGALPTLTGYDDRHAEGSIFLMPTVLLGSLLRDLQGYLSVEVSGRDSIKSGINCR